MALAKAGDAVIVPTPWYFNHEMTLRMLGIEPRPLMTDPDAGFVPDVAACEALIDDKVRAVLLVTPNNPTGAVYPPALIAAFLDLARRKGIALILDETYRDFMPEGSVAPHEAFRAPDWEDRLIHLYSFSKAYAVPGWRLGALVAGETAQADIAKVLDCLQICPPRAAQTAITWAIGALGQWRHEERAAINARAATFASAIASVPGWKLDQIGAYFAYVRHPFQGVDAIGVGEMLAKRWGLLALPGPYFGPGQENHLRFAFANVDEPRIIEAVARLARVQPG
jgi:aspartate/methionine/tyrosine aminotransferase